MSWGMQDEGAAQLVECLKLNNSVTNLNIGDNPIKNTLYRAISSGAAALAQQGVATWHVQPSCRIECARRTVRQHRCPGTGV